MYPHRQSVQRRAASDRETDDTAPDDGQRFLRHIPFASFAGMTRIRW